MELTKTVIIFVGFLVAVCSGLPAISKDVEAVTPVKTYGDQPIVDTGVFSGFDNPFTSNPFGGLFDSLEENSTIITPWTCDSPFRSQIRSSSVLIKGTGACYVDQPVRIFTDPNGFSYWRKDPALDNGIMERMRQQLSSLLNKFPLNRDSNSTDDISAFAGFDPAFPSIGGIDLSKGNTSSITKVIDGRTVVINETDYKNEDDFGGTFFKVRIIDVKPDSSELTTEKEAEAVPQESTTKDREEIANSIENEIPKSKEAEVFASSFENQDNVSLYDNLQKSNKGHSQNIETFEEIDSFENIDNTPVTNQKLYNGPIESVENRFTTNSEWSEEVTPDTINSEWNYVHPVKTLDSNTIDSGESGKEYQIPIDLSRDTYVNEIMAKNGVPVNPDAEVFVVENIKKPSPFEKLIDPR